MLLLSSQLVAPVYAIKFKQHTKNTHINYSINDFYMHIVVNVLVHCIFVLGDKVHRTPGDRWMIHGPTDYIPRTEIGNTQRRLVS